MRQTILDEKWTFRRGFLDSIGQLDEDPGTTVDLPHDGMINTPVSPDAPAGSDSGYFTGGMTNYTKYVMFPEEWKDGCTGLYFDGAMMNVTVEINGCLAGRHHYGYSPFYIDLTPYVTFGKENRITINTNTSMQPNSRWYTGSGLYRGVRLCHGPRIHIAPDGIFVYTKEITDTHAFLEARIEVENAASVSRLAEVTLSLSEEGGDPGAAVTAKKVIHISAGSTGTARMAFPVASPKLWSADDPNLYSVKASVRDLGEYRTHCDGILSATDNTASDASVSSFDTDEASALFGIRTVTADPIRGLRINGAETKLKGGCLHHDNGLLGAVSLYETESRKVKKLKEAGFNAVRTAHNPPSSALVEACDRLGMYIFDEAFDAWGIAKRGGDYSQFFEADHEKDLTAFVKRDRIHPSVIIWSTGNEIPERGGLGNGYALADELADIIRRLDATRPVSNGICSMWSGLDDELAIGQRQEQNAGNEAGSTLWERATEPFTNGLDMVGYNYMEDIYERDHEMFPERVILGSENFPQQIGYRWPLVESLPYVTGDFTWTAWDYLGEAGIGKAAYVEKDDPLVEKGPWALMPQFTSHFPWRTANCADFDITGHRCPQGDYRSVVFGSDKTYLYSMHPDTFGKVQVMSMWGFPGVLSSWNYKGYEGKPAMLVVYSRAEEVEVLVNGKSLGRKKVGNEKPMPCSVTFETVYEPGKVESISFSGGKEISRDTLITAGEPAQIALIPEKDEMRADGHDVIYVEIEIRDKDGNIVPDTDLKLTAEIEGNAVLAAFGSGNPVTDEDYTDPHTTSFRGRAMAVIRAAYEAGAIGLKVLADGLTAVSADGNALPAEGLALRSYMDESRES
ncbi:MAG: DUF4982 domain-containing protein [Lachnospiraceae bacterium]|nr:DUF4982 domain-containing protein [Lachnospiraceae bacterium]